MKNRIQTALWSAELPANAVVHQGFVTAVELPDLNGVIHISARPDTPLGSKPADFDTYVEQGGWLLTPEYISPPEPVSFSHFRGCTRTSLTPDSIQQRKWLLTDGHILIIVTYTDASGHTQDAADRISPILASLCPVRSSD